MNKILTNHIGYDKDGLKHAVFQSTSNVAPHKVEVCSESDEVVMVIEPKEIHYFGEVEKWNKGFFTRITFSDLNEKGNYYLRAHCEGEKVESRVFSVDVELLKQEVTPLLLKYFQSQRCADEWDDKDHTVPFVGDREDTVDVHGGWYDASGDKSKYLSHLNYANFMNPQQTPMVVWALANTYQMLGEESALKAQIEQEMRYGADFLVRMLDDEGYFYTTVFDKWSHDTEQREICSYKTQAGHKNDAYQASWRSGGGMAIAALAAVAQFVKDDKYIAAAQKGYQHLLMHNLEYCPDGKENIIDDYCALFASVELFKFTDGQTYHDLVLERTVKLITRISEDQNYSGWFTADKETQRPYFHAAEEGLPALALLQVLKYVPLNNLIFQQVETALRQQANFYQEVSDLAGNPFNYVKQYQQTQSQSRKPAYFYPHNNESGYWWQGENARVLSLSCALQQIAARDSDTESQLATQTLAVGAIDWVLGLNPMDMCMLYGAGENNPIDSVASHENVVGGISNGITSGLWDEQTIEFLPTFDPNHSWRWTEQWLPHSTWCLLALFAKSEE